MAGSRCAVFGRVNHESRVTGVEHATSIDDDIKLDINDAIFDDYEP